MAVPAEMTGRLKLAVAKAVMVAGMTAAGISWVEGRGRIHSSLCSHAGVRFRFSFSLVFLWEEGRFQATA
jgi:acyl-CoA reductase-like NAD-dependent aldehyde dehydrogenase